MTLVVKPKGRGNWTPRVWSVPGMLMCEFYVGMQLKLGGITWRVCEVRP
jgi:hypothetical protein